MYPALIYFYSSLWNNELFSYATVLCSSTTNIILKVEEKLPENVICKVKETIYFGDLKTFAWVNTEERCV